MKEKIHPVESASIAVVRLLSDAESCRHDDLPPLYETIDTDALDALCARSPNLRSVSFEYQGSQITVDDGESVSVSESY